MTRHKGKLSASRIDRNQSGTNAHPTAGHDDACRARMSGPTLSPCRPLKNHTSAQNNAGH
jgi:hypothetical protein